MTLQYIALDVEIPDSVDQCLSVIEAAIALQGDPVRWAVTAVESNVCRVEAVVQKACFSMLEPGLESELELRDGCE